MRLVESTLRRLSESVRTSGSPTLIHEEFALMIEQLCEEVERLEFELQKKSKENHSLRLKQDLGLNIDRMQLFLLEAQNGKTGRLD